MKPDKDRRRTRRPPETVASRIVWDFDRRTLNRAWLDYHKLPLADRIFQRFGQWFWNKYSIEGFESWPAVFYAKRASEAFELLSNLVEEKEMATRLSNRGGSAKADGAKN